MYGKNVNVNHNSIKYQTIEHDSVEIIVITDSIGIIKKMKTYPEICFKEKF